MAATQSGAHVAIVTPTASGKSLCYTLPVITAAMTQHAKALYLFPTKALAQDQVAELLELNQAGELGVKAFTFDGDTPGDARQAIRLHGDTVVSNPDMLHQAILPHHAKWAQFFENLRYVVIDEVHTYRGVFGSHVANVIRRLKRVCAFYGVTPQFILCSATIGNPQEHAEALIEDAVTAITESGAPTGDKHVLLWNPPVVNPDLGLRASARSQTKRIARLAIKSGMKTLVFAQSRTMVEVLTKYLKDVFDSDPRKPARIRAYRGGYLPRERRAAEREMRAGTIDGIVSTSALELGVDTAMYRDMHNTLKSQSFVTQLHVPKHVALPEELTCSVLNLASNDAVSVKSTASHVDGCALITRIEESQANRGAAYYGPTLVSIGSA